MTASLKKLFSERHFSICTLDSVLDVLQGTRRTDAYRLLATLHCLQYADMDPALRDRIPLLVNEALRPPVSPCIATEAALQGVAL